MLLPLPAVAAPLVFALAAPRAFALAAPQGDLGIDPITLLQWREACNLVAAHEQEIWPGYRLGDIPALMENPTKAEVLLRFPRPPPSFVPWSGPNPIAPEPLFLRRGETVHSVGMDTTSVINGVRTLVVTDRGARDGIDDAYNLCVQVHEGFHAFADQSLKIPSYSELDLADYPDLDPTRAAHLELEGDALLAALAAESADEREEHALAFLAERRRRRDGLAAAIVRAEDANEVNEGLATYVEWRALELWKEHGLSPELAKALPQFDGAKEFAGAVEQRTLQLRHMAHHTMAINGDLWGTAAVRRRAYFFGAGLGRLLDALLPEWKGRMEQGPLLIDLLAEALGDPSAEELAERADALESDRRFVELVAAKEAAAAQADAARQRRIASVLDGAGTLIHIDLSALTSGPILPASYTPFGVLRVDPQRRLFWAAPTQFAFGPTAIATKSGEVAVITDDERHELLLRTPTPAAKVLERVTRPAAPDTPAYEDEAVKIEGFVGAATTDADGSIVIRLAPPPR